jgi:hypothetical protein
LDTILTVLGGILGVAVPVLFAFAMNQGVARSPLSDAQKCAYRRTINIVTIFWTAAIWIASLTGMMNYQPGDSWPRIALPLFIPVIIALALLLHPAVKTVINNIPAATLVGVQTFRLAGFVFLIIPGLGHLPKAFVTGGYGDIATGLLAMGAGTMLARKGPVRFIKCGGTILLLLPKLEQRRAIKRCLGGLFAGHGPGVGCPDSPNFASLRHQKCFLSRECCVGNDEILYAWRLWYRGRRIFSEDSR